MANEEKNTAPRARIYILDVVVVLLAVLLAVCLWQKNNIAYFFEADTAQKTYTVSFVAEAVRYDTTGTLTAGTKLYASTDKGQIELGTLQDAPDALPYTGQSADSFFDGAHYVSLNGSFVCRGALRSGVLVLTGISLAVNDTLLVQTEYNNFRLQVVAITENA
jgi:hypothetical protein